MTQVTRAFRPLQLAVCAAMALPLLAFARAPLPIAYNEWSHAHCTQAQESVGVASNAEEWRKLWLQFGEAAPRTLQPTEKAIGIFLGSRPSGGYAINIEDVKEVANAIRVEYSFQIPTPQDIVTHALTSPCTIVIVKTGKKPLTGYRRDIR